MDINYLLILQADKVRILKSTAADKSVWQPEVKILLELKSKLEAAKKCEATSATNSCNVGASSEADIKRLEEKVAKQVYLQLDIWIKTNGIN